MKLKVTRDRKLDGAKTGLIFQVYTAKNIYKLRIYKTKIVTHKSKIMMR